MRDKLLSSEQYKAGRGRLAPILCNVAGICILLSIITTCLPVTVPRFLGYEIYNVVSGSMEPEIPVGSVVYVKAEQPEMISEGEIIAFWSNETTVIHRVVRNQTVEGIFITKGDANAGEDMNDVPYDAVIGRVCAHYPFLGEMLVLYTSKVGKAYAICFAACGAMFNILAARLRERRARRNERFDISKIERR